MSNLKISGANPHITVMNPENATNYNDPDFDENVPPILRGFISDDSLKISFVALWNEHTDENTREFQVSKFETLYLSKKDPRASVVGEDDIAIDKIITESVFPELKAYGIKLGSIVVHDYADFETIDFTFEDPEKLNILLDMIDQAFRIKIKGEK